ncbi:MULTISPECIES: reverse transcriptase/maturase family protein [unclassified Pseudomonas]|uniref:reverse transcriptase/maturase family protein n=1 Tax=Pseudomonas TaxID=286 RepID=UPI0021C48EDB|nr:MULTISPECIES: reverse transcriptase/maturase family protein [unclassified Pseudomonas]
MLNAIYEQNFLGLSYGFRPGRGQHGALNALSVGIQTARVRWLLDVDICAFFDTIDHEWMMCFLQHRIADRRVLALIARWLRTGVLENGKRISAKQGTPQGKIARSVGKENQKHSTSSGSRISVVKPRMGCSRSGG